MQSTLYYRVSQTISPFGPQSQKLLIFLGVTLVAVGIVVMLLGRMHLPLGRLPGDIVYRGKNTRVYFPLATSILLSVVLTILLYVASRWRR
jgi:hypothetical protein